MFVSFRRCVHQKALNCKAAVVQVVNKNIFKVMTAEHTHEVISSRRKPGEFKRLIEMKRNKDKY